MIFKMLIAAYLIPFILVLAIELSIGPVTPALALARAAIWPLFVTTGIPHGERARMD